MTKHNLTEHLDWLLRTKPFTPSNRSLPIDQYSPLQSEIGTSFESDLGAASISTRTPIEPGEGNVANTNSEEVDFVRPQLPTHSRDRGGLEDMARLQSGPRSTNKLRLLARTSPDPLQVPTPNSSQISRPSLAERYSADCGARVEGMHLNSIFLFELLIIFDSSSFT